MRPRQWLVVIAGCAITFLNIGFLLSFGALFLPISEKFKTNRPATALVQSLIFGVQVCGVIVGSLVDKYGLWNISLIGTVFTVTGLGGGFFATSILHLYIVSAVSGVGVAIMGLCATVAVEKVTEGRTQSTALAINTCCMGLGALVYPHLLTFLVATYGLNGTYLILAGVFCNEFVLVVVTLDLNYSTLVTHTTDVGTRDKTTTNNNVLTQHNTPIPESFLYNMKTKFLRIANTTYVITWLASVANFSATDGYLITCVDIYTSMEFTEQQGVTSMIFYQIGNISSSLITVVLKQFETVNTFVIPFSFSICGSVGVILTYFASYVQVAYAGAYFLGVSEGVLTGTLLILAEVVPKDLYGTAFGIILTSFALTSLAAGPINGALRDATGSYAVVCLAIWIALFFTAFLFIIAGYIQRKARVLKVPQPETPLFTNIGGAHNSFDNHSFTSTARPESASRSTYM